MGNKSFLNSRKVLSEVSTDLAAEDRLKALDNVKGERHFCVGQAVTK